MRVASHMWYESGEQGLAQRVGQKEGGSDVSDRTPIAEQGWA